MRQLILHIGTEKTGTTSLQNDLYRNRAHLAAHGVGLLTHADQPNNRRVASYARLRPAHEGYDLALARMGTDWREQVQTAIRTDVQQLPAHIHTLIVTSEHLHSRVVTVEEVQQVAQLFAGLFDRVRVVVYLRRQDKLAVSLYSTALRDGWTHTTPFPQKQPAAQDVYFDYEQLLSRWATVFGPDAMVVRRFERSDFVGGTLQSDFFHACGLPDVIEGFTPGVQQNESLTATVAACVLSLNRTMERMGIPREAPQAASLRGQLIQKLTPLFPHGGPTAARQEAQAFLDHFQTSNARVAHRWFDRDHLFSDEMNHYPKALPNIQIPLAAMDVMQPLLLQAMQKHGLPPAQDPQQKMLRMFNALRDIPLKGLAPAGTVRRVGLALQQQLPELSQRLLAISDRMRAAQPPKPPAPPAAKA